MNTVVRLFVLILLSMSCASAFAQPTGGCHCFRDRTYNPENKFSSDSYLLTTVFNSLTADYFSISKQQIITLKMKGGVQNDNLLIGLYISKDSGSEVMDLLSQRKKNSWQQILSALPRFDSLQQDPIYKTIADGLPDKQVAEDITGKIFTSRFGITTVALEEMVQQHYSLQEIALILTLSEQLQIAPTMITAQYRDQGLSWSEVAHNFGLQPADVGKLAGKSTVKAK